MICANTVAKAGYRAVGPYIDLSSAMLAIQKRRPDLAILDIRLQDGNAFHLAGQLIEDGVPVIFHSGHYRARDVLIRFPQALMCEKPCPPDVLIACMQKALGGPVAIAEHPIVISPTQA